MIFLYSLFCFQIRKREKENWLPYSNFPLWNRRMKNERTVYTTRDCFPFILFSSCNRKNENGYNGSYFYFSFFVWGLEKRKRMLRYPFSIFYYEIEKRKTKGRYIHGPGRATTFLSKLLRPEYDSYTRERFFDKCLTILVFIISWLHWRLSEWQL